MKKIIALLVVVAIVFFAVTLLKKRKATIADVNTPETPSLTISLVKISNGKVEQKERFLAQLASDKEAKISTKLSGYIKNIAVQESQKVSKGELLVEIDKAELLSVINTTKDNLIQQKADYELTKKIYNRNKKLQKAGALPQEKLEELSIALQSKEIRYKSTQDKIDQLNIQLNYLDIKAPYDGIIGRILLQEGNLAVPAQPILTFSQSKQKLTFSFASQSSKIKKGQKVLYIDKPIGEIKTIYTQAQNGLSVAEVEISSALSLLDGSYISIEVITGEHIGCIVPSDTIVHTHSGSQIMLYRDLQFISQRVDILFEDESEALISSCPKGHIARGSETKLSKLPFYQKVVIRGEGDE